MRMAKQNGMNVQTPQVQKSMASSNNGQACGLPPLSAKVIKEKKAGADKPHPFPMTRKSTLSNSGMRVMEQKPYESASSKFFSPPSESVNTEQVDQYIKSFMKDSSEYAKT